MNTEQQLNGMLIEGTMRWQESTPIVRLYIRMYMTPRRPMMQHLKHWKMIARPSNTTHGISL
jgi:hypothetical protein